MARNYEVRRMCQTCGKYFGALSQHVIKVHKTTITDEIVAGRWKNENFYEEPSG